jgi:hypothetical protein
MSSPRSSRTLTVFAAGFLALDGILLMLAGLWSDRLSLLVWGIACTAAAVGVYASWRRHLRRLAELDAAYEDRRAEFQRMARELEHRRES